MMDRFNASFAGAILAAGIANDAGVPLWRTWNPGDIADISLFAFLLIWFSIKALQGAHLQPGEKG